MTVLSSMILLLSSVFFLIRVFVPLVRKLVDRSSGQNINEMISLSRNSADKGIKNV